MIDGLEMGRTPATFNLRRPGLSGKNVTLRLAGYEDRNFALQSSFNTVSLINILFWPGFIVDVATGSIMKYSPTTYSMTMEQARGAMARELGVDHVVLMSELSTDLTGAFVIPEGAEGIKIAVLDMLNREAVVLK